MNEGAFVSNPKNHYFARCCRVHKLVFGYQVGRCGLCGERPTELATRAEYDAQKPLDIPVGQE